MSDKSVAFVVKNLEYTKTNPEFVPPFLSVTDMEADVNAIEQLRPLFKEIQQITDNLDDTLMLSGSEAFNAALLYYNNVKQAIKGNVPGAKTIYEDLSKRYTGRTTTSSTPSSETTK